MTANNDFDAKVALLLPLYLRKSRAALVKQAETQRTAARRAWTSLRQANWLGEVAARATTVRDIIDHLETQGERWADKDTSPRFHAVIVRQIGDSLRREVTAAMQTTSKEAAQVLKVDPPSDFSPDAAWVDQEQLNLARLYIGALVAWRRIDSVQEISE